MLRADLMCDVHMPVCVDILPRLQTRLDFASFVRACELQEGCKGLNLRSYLIMPVQRIPR